MYAALLLLLAACVPKSAFGPPVREVSLEELKANAPVGRLSGLAWPLAYRVDLTVNPNEPRFSGHVEIDINLETSATGIWMHGLGLDVSDVEITAGGETRRATWTEVDPTGVVWVGFPNRVPGGGVTLTVDYDAPFDANLAGLFRVVEQGQAYALAKSESIQARRFLPSFDEPGFKAPFDISLTIPAGMTAISNTPVSRREPAGSDFERVTFLRTRPLSTYLLSVAVGNFERVDAGVIPPNAYREWPVPLSGYARRGKGAELANVLAITPAIIRFYEESLRQPYPYDKLDLIAAPQWPSGATELAAAVTYRESRILSNPQSGPQFIRAMKSVHAHELAHMWFGDLVTPPWWNDLWLKEGFASWAEPAVLSSLEPDGGYDVTAIADSISAMRLDSLASARAVAEPIFRNDDIRNAYDSITYNKGLAVLNMVDHWFGPDVFRPALGDYIATFADKAADSDDFFRVIGQATDNPEIGKSLKSFVAQNGVPLLDAELQCAESGAKVALDQSRYRPLGSTIDPNRLWTIPVCISWQEGDKSGRSCSLLASEHAVVPLSGATCPDVYHPNAGGTGYYRFALADRGWAKLADALPDMEAGEALTALDSGMAAFAAGRLDASMLRRLLASASANTNPTVAGTVIDAYTGLMERLAGAPAEGLSADALAMSDAMRARIATDPSNMELKSRLDAFDATVLKRDDTRARLAREIDAWLGNPSADSGLSGDLFAPALSVFLDEGGMTAYSRVLAAYTDIDDPAFGQAVASALGGVTDAEQAARTRELVGAGTLGPRETFTLAAGQMSHPETRDAMWNFLAQNFPAFLKAVPTQWQRATPRLAGPFCDQAGLDALNQLFSEYGTLAEGHERALAETREAITLCMAQKEANQADLETAFGTP
ncbi:MAG TPA: M1 family aminopeptidase [Hyphomonas sp.]|nr:ERAP1-like C-terminal domain-containing protein [Hyphomonas sp.]HPE49580.1 M1 family aminopeptidase [Hyphomonas sp.]